MPEVVRITGKGERMPSTRRVTDGAGAKPPVRMIPDSGGKPPALCALSSASSVSSRSPAAITSAPVLEAIEQVLGCHRADEDGSRLAAEQLRVAGHELGARRGGEFAQSGATRMGSSGSAPMRTSAGSAARIASSCVGVAAIGEDRRDVSVIEFEVGTRLLCHLGYLRRRAIDAVHHERNGSREVRRDARIEFELRGTGDVRVVGANDDNRIAAPGHVVIARNDGRERGLGVGVDVVVGDANALLVGEVNAVVRQVSNCTT